VLSNILSLCSSLNISSPRYFTILILIVPVSIYRFSVQEHQNRNCGTL
jgi:hypothetical protein